jgi:DNA-binding CsgD family transcriptional regulator
MTPASTAQTPPGSTSKASEASVDATTTTTSGNSTGSAATVRDPLEVTIPKLRRKLFRAINIPGWDTNNTSPEDSEQIAWVHVLQYAKNNPAFELCCARWGILKDLQRTFRRNKMEQGWERLEQCREGKPSRPIRKPEDPTLQVDRRDYLEFLFRAARLTPYQAEICQAKGQGIAFTQIAQRRGVTKQAVQNTWQTVLHKFRNIIKTHSLPEII